MLPVTLSHFRNNYEPESAGRSRRSLAQVEDHPPNITPIGGVPNLKVGARRARRTECSYLMMKPYLVIISQTNDQQMVEISLIALHFQR